jgi:hypothetical protein
MDMVRDQICVYVTPSSKYANGTHDVRYGPFVGVHLDYETC